MALLMADPALANSTTVHSKLVCQDRYLILTGASYMGDFTQGGEWLLKQEQFVLPRDPYLTKYR